MNRQLLINLRKRKERMYEFYYKAYGQIIKKHRLALNITQEYLAASICSNTYISKAENNQVVVGEDQLFMIMERLNVPKDEFSKPETLVRYLRNITDYFYYRDIKAYGELVDSLKDYQFHSVIELVRLGYYVLIKDYDKASKIYDELLDYLSSFDDFAFSVFLTFSSIYNLKVREYKVAKHLIDSIYLVDLEFPNLITLIDYTKYQINGNLDIKDSPNRNYHNILTDLVETGNIEMINELMVLQATFKAYMGIPHDFRNFTEVIKNVDSQIVNEYLLIKMCISGNALSYIELIEDKECEAYIIGLYILAKNALATNEKDLYTALKNQISDLHYKTKSKIDYGNLLNLKKKNDMSFYKEYLINPCLKHAKDKQHIYLMKAVTAEIVRVLQSRSRYKDALTYQNKLKSDISKLQGK